MNACMYVTTATTPSTATATESEEGGISCQEMSHVASLSHHKHHKFVNIDNNDDDDDDDYCEADMADGSYHHNAQEAHDAHVAAAVARITNEATYTRSEHIIDCTTPLLGCHLRAGSQSSGDVSPVVERNDDSLYISDILQQYNIVRMPTDAEAAITDQMSDEVDTTQMLQKCNDKVVTPVRYFLCMLAFQPFPCLRNDQGAFALCANVIYALLICLAILYNYTYDIYGCITRHVGAVCSELISVYVVPDLVNLICFTYGMYHFRYQSGFDVHVGMIEQVFLQSPPSTYRTLFGDLSQPKLIFTLKRYIIFGFLWLVIRLTYNAFYYSWLHKANLHFLEIFLMGLQLASKVVSDAVYMTIVVVYVIQCRVVLFYIDGLRNRANQRKKDFKSVQREVMQVHKYIRGLNRKLGLAVSMSMFMFSIYCLNGFIELTQLKNTNPSPYKKVMIVMNLLIWLVILTCVLVQAARISSKCQSIKDLVLTLREQGYRDTSQQELDSFVLFATNLRMNAEIFSVPITMPTLGKVFFIFITVILMMFQLGIIEIWISK